MPVTNQLEIDIKAKSDKATASLDKLISKLNEVNTALNGLNTAKINEISNGLKGLKGVHLNTRGSGGSGSNNSGNNNAQTKRTATLLDLLTSSSNRASHSILNFRGSMLRLAATWGTFYAAMYPVIRLFRLLGSKVEESMDYVETYNYFIVTMNKIGHDAGDEFAEGYLAEIKDLNKKLTSFEIGSSGELFETGDKSLGLDPNAVMQFQARIGAVTNSVGLLGDASIATQKALTMLSSDLSSLKNEDLESVMTNLSSGLIGQSRALYKYGIDITNATLKTYAYEHGVTKAVSAMTQAEKMQLRVLAILDQSKVAWGDQANTISSVANQYRLMKQQVSNLGRVIGNLFLPIVQKVLPYLNAFIIAMRKITTMLGFKLFGGDWLKDLNSGISSGNFDGLEEDVDDVSDAMDGATNSAKKLKQAVMGFDELNIISPNTSSGGGSGSGGGGSFDLSDDINAALAEYEKVWNDAFNNMANKAEELADKFMSFVEAKDWFGLGRWLSDGMASILESINWENIFEGARNFGTGLAQFMNGLIRPSTFYSVGRTVANSLNTAIYTALAFGQEFDFKKLGEAIGSYWNGIFENFDFKSFGRTIGIWVGGITKTIATAIRKIKWDKLFNGIKYSIDGFFKGFFESGVNIGDIAIVLGALTIKKILQFHWAATAIQAISQSLAKALATRIGFDIAADATIGNALAKGFAAHMSILGANISRLLSSAISTNIVADSLVGVETFGAKATAIFGTTGAAILGFGSIIGGVALTVHEFFDIFENGVDGMSVALAIAGAAITAFGVAVTGPIGLVAAGFTALIGVAIECGKRIKELDEIHSEELFNEIIQGTEDGTHTLQDFVDHMGITVETVTTGLDEVNTKFEELETSRNEIKQTTDTIGTIALAMQSGRTLTEDEINQLGESFSKLKTQLQEMVSASYDYVIAAEYADYNYLVKTQGYSDELYDEYSKRIQGLYELKQATLDNANVLTDDAQIALENYQNVMADGNSTIEERDSAFKQLFDATVALTDATNQYSDDSENMDAVLEKHIEKLQEFKGGLDLTDVDLENWDDVKTEVSGTIDSLTTKYNEGVEELSGFKDSYADYVNKLGLSSEEANKRIEEHNAIVDDRLKTLRETYQTELGYLKGDVVELIPQIISSAGEEWNKLSNWEKVSIYGGDSGNYVKSQVTQFVNDVINGDDGLSASFDTAFNNANLVQKTTLQNTTKGVVDDIFDTFVINMSNGQYMTTISQNYEDIINNAIKKIDVSGEASKSAKKIGKKYAEDTQEGYNKQIDTGMPNTDEKIREWMKKVDTSMHDSVLEFGSPSKRMGTYALWTIEGYNNGIDDNKNLSEAAMAGLATAIVQSFNTSLGNVKTSIDTWYKNSVSPYFTTDRWVALSQGMEEGLSKRWSDFDSWWKNTGFANWWNNNVTPWFKIETWTPFGDNFKTALSTKWIEFNDWWTNTGFADWWNNNVNPWFKKDKWLPFGENVKSALTDKWNAFTTWWATTGIANWWANSVEPYFTKDKWTFSGIKDGLKQAFDNAIAAVKEAWNSFAEHWNSKLTWTLPSVELPNGETVGGNTVSLGKIPTFAVGGFPEDGLFFANHSELVGQFSNGQTAVANNEQIVEGIRSGVASAVREELGYYLRDIADNTNATANNTEDIKNKPNQTLSNRDIARANRIGSRSMGLTLRTT